MNLEKELRVAIKNFISMKKDICEQESGPSDLVPMIHFKYQHLAVPCGAVIVGDPFHIVPQAWRRILDDGIPEFIMFMAEGYSSSKNSENRQRGDLEKDFKENPCSDVTEVITIQAVDIKTGIQMSAMAEYKYNDNGQPEFGKIHLGKCEGDTLKSNVAMMFATCRNATLEFFGKVAS